MKLMPKAFHVQAVDALPTTTSTTDKPVRPPVDLVKLSAITISTATELVKIGGAMYVLKKIVDASTEIAVIAAKAKLR